MASVFKRTRDKGNRLSSWYVAHVDADGVRRMTKGCPDKAATEALARKLESEAELRRRGVIDARSDHLAAHEARHLADHLADWHADATARGMTRRHADQFRTPAARVAAMVRGARL